MIGDCESVSAHEPLPSLIGAHHSAKHENFSGIATNCTDGNFLKRLRFQPYGGVPMIARIRELVDNFGGLSIDVMELPETSDLYSAGLKSQACVELMLGLEEAFEVEFPDELLTRSTFRSLASIAAAVSSLKEGAVAA
jgi:acyl carrier protein